MLMKCTVSAWRRRFRLIPVVGIALFTGVFSATPASAADSGSISFSRNSLAAGPAAISVIRCDYKIDYPHNSGHNPGNVNVVARITCTNQVESITVDTKLFRSGIQVGSGHTTVPFAGFAQGNAAAPCINGASWGGTVRYSVVPPPGYVPNPGVANAASLVVPITCA